MGTAAPVPGSESDGGGRFLISHSNTSSGLHEYPPWLVCEMVLVSPWPQEKTGKAGHLLSGIDKWSISSSWWVMP